ncbi:hypothetical protein [Succinimonas sp.]|uniref:hypothetical protein n=1 Tax=Succinimonas sp. TaxID=1936151 RepID=UPI003868277A
MKGIISRRLFPVLAALGCLVLSGCGDPVLDLSGTEQENTARLADFLNHFNKSDRALIMGWLAADTLKGLEKMNGKKASEVLEMVNSEWRELYTAEAVNAKEIYRWMENEKVPVFGMKEFSDLCENPEKVPDQPDDLLKTRAHASRAAQVYRNFHITCRLGAKSNEAELVLDNGTDMPMTKGTVKALDAQAEFAVPGGLDPGQKTQLTLKNPALAKRLREKHECVPVYAEFLDWNSGNNFHLDYYAPENAIKPEDMDDYAEFRQKTLQEINGSYDRKAVIRKLCDMNHAARERTENAVKAFTASYPERKTEVTK